MPMCQKRELEIERELAAILRELERQLIVEKSEKPEPAAQLRWPPSLPHDQGK